jgi:hypothetical protein
MNLPAGLAEDESLLAELATIALVAVTGRPKTDVIVSISLKRNHSVVSAFRVGAGVLALGFQVPPVAVEADQLLVYALVGFDREYLSTMGTLAVRGLLGASRDVVRLGIGV